MNLPRRGIDQIVAANNIRNALKGIIDHHRQLIGENPVRPANRKIAYTAL